MNEDMLEALRERVTEYSEKASLARNAHMNGWRGPDPSAEVSSSLVTKFLATVPDFPGRTGTVFYQHLVSYAKRYLHSLPEEEVTKALLVDYINWAAFRFYGMDLALYTSDI